MNDLITLHGDAFERFQVDGRELHALLRVKTVFRNWIPRRIEEYGFIEGSDFRPFLDERSGLRVAGKFEKEHKNVMQSIDRLE